MFKRCLLVVHILYSRVGSIKRASGVNRVGVRDLISKRTTLRVPFQLLLEQTQPEVHFRMLGKAEGKGPQGTSPAAYFTTHPPPEADQETILWPGKVRSTSEAGAPMRLAQAPKGGTSLNHRKCDEGSPVVPAVEQISCHRQVPCYQYAFTNCRHDAPGTMARVIGAPSPSKPPSMGNTTTSPLS